MGRDIQTKYTEFWIDNAAGILTELTDDLIPSSIANPGLVAQGVDMTAENSPVEVHQEGRPKAPFSVKFHTNNTASTGAYTILTAIRGTGPKTVNIRLGTGGAPTSGDPQFGGEVVCTGVYLSPDEGRWITNADFMPADPGDIDFETVT